MLHKTQIKAAEAVELPGDLHPLVEQPGPAEGLAILAGASGLLPAKPISDAADLRRFLQNYRARILEPVELPAIQRAFTHASRNEVRELIALDGQLAGEPLWRDFAPASRRIGRERLGRLRPLRDQRWLQRYLAAVGRGEAQGWHTLVHGLTLAVYSLPLRQGLLGYAHQNTLGFIRSAALSMALSEAHSRELFEELCVTLPAAIESILSPRRSAGPGC